jgi:phosphoribosylamine--glycine ligase
VITAGGRVLAVSGLGKDLAEARRRAYEAASRISFEGMHHRADIAEEAASGG